MKYLAYCILSSCDAREAPRPNGLDGNPITVIEAAGLAVACSPAPGRPAEPPVSDLLAYAAVIDRMHQACPVLPLRFGSLLEGTEEMEQVLRRRHDEFAQALAEVGRCVEMGLRALADEEPIPVERETVPHDIAGEPAPQALPESGAGVAYLRRRREAFAIKDQQQQARQSLAEAVRQAFAGLFVCWTSEVAEGEPRLTSFHFLVRRADVEPFRGAFRRLQKTCSARLLLTGPWPPYNFVNSGKRRNE